MSKINFADTRT